MNTKFYFQERGGYSTHSKKGYARVICAEHGEKKIPVEIHPNEGVTATFEAELHDHFIFVEFDGNNFEIDVKQIDKIDDNFFGQYLDQFVSSSRLKTIYCFVRGAWVDDNIPPARLSPAIEAGIKLSMTNQELIKNCEPFFAEKVSVPLYPYLYS